MRWLCLLPLLVGCSALTEFDYTFGDAGGGADAGATDAGATDAGPMDGGGPSDGGADGGSDAGAGFAPCPASCVGELAEDFVPGEQGVGGLSWRFVTDPRDRLGIDYADMRWDAMVEAYTDGVARIGRCVDADCPPASFEMTVSGAFGESDPAIELVAPTTGVFRLGVGHARRGEDAAQLLVTRGHRADAVAVIDLPASLTENALRDATVDVFLRAGERLRIVLRARDPDDTPAVAIVPWLAESSVDTCLALLAFDTWPALPAQCAMLATELLSSSGGPVPTETPGPHPDFGSALRTSRADDSYARISGTAELDLSGDFTIQLWARREGTGASAQLEAIFANPGDDPTGTLNAGGLSLDYDAIHPEDALELSVFLADGTIADEVSGYDPGVDEWHFYRIVRRAEQVQLCVDGESIIAPFSAPGDLTSTRDVRLGRFRTDGVFFTGSIDELAFFSEALPCEVSAPPET